MTIKSRQNEREKIYTTI